MKHIRFLKALFIVVTILTMASPVNAQTGFVDDKKLDEPGFQFDFATFRSEASEEVVSLEIYYKIFNDGLQYIKQEDRFVADYEFNVVILGTDNNQVTGYSRERKHEVNTYKDTKSGTSFLVNQIELQVPQGKFKVVCKLIDKISGKVSSGERDLHVGELFRNEIDMSAIEFILATNDTTAARSAFDKGEKRIVPAVSRSLSGESGHLSFYVELYNQETTPAEATIVYKVRFNESKTVYTDELAVVLDKPVIRLIKAIPTDDLRSGSYDVLLELKDDHNRSIAQRKERFEVEWSLTAMIKHDFETAVDQLRYIASKEETEMLKKTEVGLRSEAFEEFWRGHDKYPETPENETRELYYSRVRHADKYFSVVNQPGWRTDRGRIYIIFGEPDNVERYPFELESVPYQIWYYFKLSRTFVFEDTHHTGDYYLKFPYDGKRGGLHETFEDFD